MKRSLLLVILLLAASGTAKADTIYLAEGTYTFETVDDWESGRSRGDGVRPILVGVLRGESTAYTYRVRSYPGSVGDEIVPAICDRAALLAMTRPGRYYFRVTLTSVGPYYTAVAGCALVRR